MSKSVSFYKTVVWQDVIVCKACGKKFNKCIYFVFVILLGEKQVCLSISKQEILAEHQSDELKTSDQNCCSPKYNEWGGCCGMCGQVKE